jgi:hypothetical protein
MTAAVREEQIPAEFLYWEHVHSRRVQRWRRNRWYANETGGRDAEFTPVEEFRR